MTLRIKFPPIALLLCFACALLGRELPPDLVVAADGTGDCRTITEALARIPRDNRERKVVLVRKGTYREKLRVDASFVTLRGENRKETRIEYPQLNDEYHKNPDNIGRAVINLGGDDFILENLTVANTAGIVGPHSFTIYGQSDKTVIVDCDILSEGADTLSLWKGDSGRYYHARCHIRGAVDFVCPRGWCYMTDCCLYETKDTAAVWHDGRMNKDMKFVLRSCRVEGVPGFVLARHHNDAQFYFLDCSFAKTMRDLQPKRVIYPLDGGKPSAEDLRRNADYDKKNQWGERNYFSGSHREGGDFSWHADNLDKAPGAPKKEQITAAWSFAGTWNPESEAAPQLRRFWSEGGFWFLEYAEPVTVKGTPRLDLGGGRFADYVGGGGATVLKFADPKKTQTKPKALNFDAGLVFASEASAKTRFASESLVPAAP